MKRFCFFLTLMIIICINGISSNTSKLLSIKWQKNGLNEEIFFKFTKIPQFTSSYENYPALIRIHFFSTLSNIGLPAFQQSKLTLQPWCMFAVPSNDGLELCIVFSKHIDYKITKNVKTNTVILSIKQKDNNIIMIHAIRTKSFIDFDENDILNMKTNLEKLCGHKVRIIPGELFSIVIDIEQFIVIDDAEKRYKIFIDNSNLFDLIIEHRKSNELPRCILAKGQDFNDDEGD